MDPALAEILGSLENDIDLKIQITKKKKKSTNYIHDVTLFNVF